MKTDTNHAQDDPSEAELDRIIAEQLKTMPAREHADHDRQGVRYVAPTVQRGRGIQSSGFRVKPSRKNW